MPGPSVSVIVASHGRPALLRRCLTGVFQLRHRPVELVVVADRAGLAAISDLPFAARIKLAEQQLPNISVARNAGVALAGGDLLAFIDDDAVPEPTWLCHLAAAFTRPEVMAAGGPVIGRNGISLQWGSRAVNALAEEVALPEGDPDPTLPPDHALKLQGTNFALRRKALEQIGGFDPAYAFYLDDTDMALRLYLAGLRAVSVPRAVVHHGFAPSSRRRANRAPTSLFEIGASMAVYLRKHAPADKIAPTLAGFRAAQERRLSRFVLTAAMEPRDMRRLRADLGRGIAAGMARGLEPAPGIPDTAPPFCPLRDDPPQDPVYLEGGLFGRAVVMARARALADAGACVTVLLLEPGPRAHRMAFDPSGVWVQTGGVLGRSDRKQPRLRFWRRHLRIAAEIDRINRTRGFFRADGE